VWNINWMFPRIDSILQDQRKMIISKITGLRFFKIGDLNARFQCRLGLTTQRIPAFNKFCIKKISKLLSPSKMGIIFKFLNENLKWNRVSSYYKRICSFAGPQILEFIKMSKLCSHFILKFRSRIVQHLSRMKTKH